MNSKKNKYKAFQDNYEADKAESTPVLKNMEAKIKKLRLLIDQSQQAIDSMPVGIVIYNSKGKVKKYNKQFTQLFGYKQKDVPTIEDWFSRAYPDTKYRKELGKKWYAAVEQYHQTKTFKPIEGIVRCKDGSYKEIEFSFEAFEDTYLTTFIDLTERNKALKRLAKAEEFSESILNSIPTIFFMYEISEEGARLIKWNKNYQTLLGHKPEKLIGAEPFLCFDKIENERVKYIYEQIISKKEFDFEAYLKYGDGTSRPYYFKTSTFKESNQQFFFGIGMDMSKQKKAEDELKISEKKYRLLFENANDAIFLMDGEIFIDCNEQTLKIFECKRGEIIGKPPYVFSPEFQPDGSSSKDKAIELINKSLKKKIDTFEWQHQTLAGKLFYAEVSLNSIQLNNKTYIQAIVRNTNERKIAELELQEYKNNLEKLVKKRAEALISANENLRAANEELSLVNEQIEIQKKQLSSTLDNLKETQAQLVQSEKMASIGVLTAGVAHEINNPLNYIQAGIYGLEHFFDKLKDKEDREILHKILNDMQIGIDRVAGIVTGLNSFSRTGFSIKEPCKVHQVINNCILLLEYKLREKCTLVTEFFDEDFSIVADEGKLHHVFTNIILNAINAIENEGVIKIKTTLNKKQDRIKILIEDNGKGISEENLEKIYDPFFTTNAPGKGPGLGLSIVFRIIEEHKGTILYTSEVNKGTKVHIRLPIKNVT